MSSYLSAQFKYMIFHIFTSNSYYLNDKIYPNSDWSLNPLSPKSVLYILLCLTPDEFTRQREIP